MISDRMGVLTKIPDSYVDFMLCAYTRVCRIYFVYYANDN